MLQGLVRPISILPADLDILSEQAKDSEQTRQGPTGSDLIQELVAVHVFLLPDTTPGEGGRLSSLCIELYIAVDDAVEAHVLVKGQRVSCNKPPGLQMPCEFVKDLEAARCQCRANMNLSHRMLTGFSKKPKTRTAWRKSSR